MMAHAAGAFPGAGKSAVGSWTVASFLWPFDVRHSGRKATFQGLEPRTKSSLVLTLWLIPLARLTNLETDVERQI